MNEHVILVDELDNAVGTEEKMKAHREGKLHRAFSVVLFNPKDEVLLQRRAHHKYHSPGLWANTCCSHPRPGESLEDAAKRRLHEEMGISCKVEPAFSFLYRADVAADMVEHELDHVLTGHFDGEPRPNPDEVAEWKWVSVRELKTDLSQNPERYSAWLKPIVERLPTA